MGDVGMAEWGVGAVASSSSRHAMPAIVRFSAVVPTQSHVQLWRYIQKPTLGAMTIARTDASPQYAIPSARRAGRQHAGHVRRRGR